MTIVAITGFVIGKIILTIRSHKLHPSIIAASSISVGKAFKYPTNSNVLNEIDVAT